MGLHLIAVDMLSLDFWYVAIQVVVGLGFVIFVHELGHFLVAKACGVKCEKFYVGFDVPIKLGWGKYGIKLPAAFFKRKWGETEYGIGVIPLGGYVKMLGQDDNPHKIAEEVERSKAGGEEPNAAAAAAAEEVADEKAVEAAAPARPVKLDPRSYLAKSVPQRMAIISAGVIMNIIFAVIMASVAYGIGVPYTPCIVGSLDPAGPAWKAGLRPGDVILKVNDIDKPRFEEDLFRTAAYGDPVTLLVERREGGVARTFTVTIQPAVLDDSDIHRLGIGAMSTVTLEPRKPLPKGSPVARAAPALQPGDTIVEVQGTPIRNQVELFAALARHCDEQLSITVERRGSPDATNVERIEKVLIERTPKRGLGLVMSWGSVAGVQPDSPAEKAGMKEGDVIVKVDGQDPGDPMTFPDRMRGRAGQTVVLTVRRGNQDVELRPVEVRVPTEIHLPDEGRPLSAPALGIAYHVGNVIAAIEPGSPAEKSGKLAVGNLITFAVVVQPRAREEDERGLPKEETEVKLSADKPSWAYFQETLVQLAMDGSKVRLTVHGSKEPIELAPQEFQYPSRAKWFAPRRGFRLKEFKEIRKAEGFGEAASLGLRETKESVLMVVDFIKHIDRLWKHAGGPIAIVGAAAHYADRGFADLLIFLAMLSANLAVINSLPIPVLDGGHFMFLTIEGIRRKPLSERAFVICSYMGFLFILGLMVFVITLDISRLIR
ncbi:MAG: site-2 protease family protein [Planctomycetia bacterium]|nr:site-2 protease family protein [Planctomycetia bacterium]